MSEQKHPADYTPAEVDAMPAFVSKFANEPLDRHDVRNLVTIKDSQGRKYGFTWQGGKYVKYPR